MKTISAELFAKITGGFGGQIRYIRVTKRCLIAWHIPNKEDETHEPLLHG